MSRPIIVMGCSSDAGKSFVVTALCRHMANRGVRVAPFKAQNMSNNAAVTPDGAEIGRAQYLQALAARTTPQARMNPVLLKPSADTESQVIVLGRVDPAISAMPWLERQPRLWPIVREALYSLMHDYEQVVIEGGGSPAETNLRASDSGRQTSLPLLSSATERQISCHLVISWDACPPSETSYKCSF